MYPGKYAKRHPTRPALVMASTGETLSYGEYETRCNQLAHLLRSHGLQYGDHYAIFMENQIRYIEACGAGERAGLHYTPINSYLKAEELAYIVNNCDAKVLITSSEKADISREALANCPKVELMLVIDAADDESLMGHQAAIAEFPNTPIEDESLGSAMIYSSGTTGRPKGILRPLADAGTPPGTLLPSVVFTSRLWKYREDMVYLSPAPLYHSAPQTAVGNAIRQGATVIIMERFDPKHFLDLVKRYKVTHSMMVPTMFSRILKLSEDVRNSADLSSLEAIVHAAAPCPVPVKEQMISWWGPIIYEFYSATEGLGLTYCTSEQWLAHKGTVGRVLAGELHILDDDGQAVAPGSSGELWFKRADDYEYYKDTEKTKESTSPDGTLSSVGDVGYLDEDGFLYLTDRSTFMIISGGVNIYPQECENLLITHPKVADAAVFGVPNSDLGEEVKAVVQVLPGVAAGGDLETVLIEFCKANLGIQKCPRSVDFVDELPRLPTGKLYKKELRASYWGNQSSNIVQ